MRVLKPLTLSADEQLPQPVKQQVRFLVPKKMHVFQGFSQVLEHPLAVFIGHRRFIRSRAFQGLCQLSLQFVNANGNSVGQIERRGRVDGGNVDQVIAAAHFRRS